MLLCEVCLVRIRNKLARRGAQLISMQMPTIYEIGICCASAKHAAYRRKVKLVCSESE